MRKPWYAYLYIKSPILKIIVGILAVMLPSPYCSSLGWLTALAWKPKPRTGMAALEKGAEVYANNCVPCHGLEGRGNPGPALNSRYFFTSV